MHWRLPWIDDFLGLFARGFLCSHSHLLAHLYLRLLARGLPLGLLFRLRACCLCRRLRLRHANLVPRQNLLARKNFVHTICIAHIFPLLPVGTELYSE